MEQKRLERRWTLIVAPLGAAIVFLSVIITGGADDLAYTVALYSFSLAIPLLCLIAFLTSLQEATSLPKWWEASILWLLLAGYALVAIGIGALLHRDHTLVFPAWEAFAAACVVALVIAAFALPKPKR